MSRVLGPELDTLRPIFDHFCARHDFVYAPKLSLGTYPRIRVQRGDAPTLWIDLWMELDGNGERFVEYTPDLPYELSAGSFLDRDATRYSEKRQCISNISLAALREILAAELERALALITPWDAAYLVD